MNSIKGTGEIYSVSQLNSEVKSVIEGNFPMVWVEGEISNLAQPASGHIYFTLKDARSQVRCAMFRMRRSMLNFQPESGMKVMIYARVGLYEGRGEYQLVAERMEPSGEGALQLAFEQLKAKLDNEGLFDPAIKRALPAFPKTVGIVTSPTGAAIKDILSVLNRRFPALEVIIYPTLVQGDTASHSIARMIMLATERKECDVLIVTRGGGSLEDLWSFNEEVVARSIVDCDIPVVSGVGHEVDFTIADFVADMRAPTPSAAAELISQDQEKIRQNVESYESWMHDQLQQQLKHLSQRVAWNEQRLIDPRRRLEDLAQRLDDLTVRMNASMRAEIDQRRVGLSDLVGDLKQHSPDKVIAMNTERCQQYSVRMKSAMQHQLEKLRAKLGEAGRTLNTVSPLATLDRGYSIVQTETEQVVHSIKDVNEGDQVTARLAVGTLICTVDQCIEAK